LSYFFDPEVFLEIAKKLIHDREYDQKGRLRTSIGRSYYAAFLKSKMKLESLGKTFYDDSRLHADVRNKLIGIKKSNIAVLLERLFDIRVMADYFPKARIDILLCDKSITLSENIIKLIDEL